MLQDILPLSLSLASDFGSLAEHVKDGSKTSVQQSQQQVHGMQSQMTPQAQAAAFRFQQVCSVSMGSS